MKIALLLTLFLASTALATPRTVYLTFDDGPEKGTEEVLQVLGKRPATFFLVADNAGRAGGREAQKQMLGKIIKAGYKVGNHTKTHHPELVSQYKSTYSNPLTAPQKAAFRANFEDNLAYFRHLLEDKKFTFHIARLPGAGREYPYLVTETEALSLKHYAWNFEFAPNDTFDWVKNRDWQHITGVSCSSIGFPPAQAVILFHDRHWKGQAALLKQVIAQLENSGCTFALLPD